MFNENDITVFAETNFRNNYRKFGIKIDDRRRHMYLIGKTGMGKSTVLENMIVGDIRAGRGVAVVDPHGDLAEKVIEYIPANRVNDVIYFNPSDIEYPLAFNVVEQVEPHLRHLVASGLIGVFQKLWADSWGPRLEYILRNAILAILDYPGSTLLGITRMLADKNFRKKVVEKIQDPVVKSFWVNEFSNYASNFASEAVSPIQNKVGQFLSSSLIRNIVGQVKSTIDLRQIMDEGKILILNLSKGRIGEDNSSLLGAMMITKLQLAVMSRVDIPEKQRRDFYLYIDEFQNFTTDSFANILSEARKYRLSLIMAHQYIEQLGEKVEAAVFGNVGTLVVFRVGATDAEELVKEFTPTFTEEDLVNLPKHEFYLKLMIDGIASDPFSARGLPPLTESEKTGNTDKVIKVSRERYAKRKTIVEEKISRWHAVDEPSADEKATSRKDERGNYKKAVGGQRGHEINQGPIRSNAAIINQNKATALPNEKISIAPPKIFFNAQTRDARGNGRNISEAEKATGNDAIYKFDARCSRCGKITKVSFMPDGIRPVFCKDCLTLAKEEKKQEIESRFEAKKRELLKLQESEARKKRLSEEAAADVQAEPLTKNTVEEIGLTEALERGPVDFSGKKLAVPAEPDKRHEARARDNEHDSDDTKELRTAGGDKANEGVELKEDEDVRL